MDMELVTVKRYTVVGKISKEIWKIFKKKHTLQIEEDSSFSLAQALREELTSNLQSFLV